MGDEKRTVCSYRYHDDCDGGFSLEPKCRPRGVNLAMAGVSSSDLDYRRQRCEDTEA